MAIILKKEMMFNLDVFVSSSLLLKSYILFQQYFFTINIFAEKNNY